MQRDVLQAACRPGDPDAPRAARISFQTDARTVVTGTVRAAGRNRTTPRVADRLDGSSNQRHDLSVRRSSRASRSRASVRAQAPAARHRAAAGNRIRPHARTVQPRFRTRTPSRGCDARRTPHPVFTRASHPAPRRATRATLIRPATLAERSRAA
ncbi:hypothetical protein ACVK00_002759 [Burkholderia sp. PvR073]|uniref:hypothetical protein n=1 Tax=Burkholderia TaxID=32008 RepID=UPI00254C74CA|nr:hypothetical protein [Burkholderia sp. lyk4-R2A-23]